MNWLNKSDSGHQAAGPYRRETDGQRTPSDRLTSRQGRRPGMTGLWQVSGRSDTGTDGMEQFDSYYVRNWSIWLDIVVITRTLSAVMKSSGAY